MSSSISVDSCPSDVVVVSVVTSPATDVTTVSSSVTTTLASRVSSSTVWVISSPSAPVTVNVISCSSISITGLSAATAITLLSEETFISTCSPADTSSLETEILSSEPSVDKAVIAASLETKAMLGVGNDSSISSVSIRTVYSVNGGEPQPVSEAALIDRAEIPSTTSSEAGL